MTDELNFYKTKVYPNVTEKEILAKIAAAEKAEADRKEFIKTIIFRKKTGQA